MRLDKIRKQVEEYLNVDVRAVNRKKEFVRAKRLYCFVSRHVHNHSLYAIAEEANIDHSSVYHHSAKFKQWLEMGDSQSVGDLYRCFGIDATKDKAIQRREKTVDKFLELLNTIPEDKHEEAYKRIEAMVKGYNQKHEDTITLINGYESIAEFIK